MILTNSRMTQSALWSDETRSVAAGSGPGEDLWAALRLYGARRGAEAVVVLGSRAAFFYGALTRLFGAGPPWIAKELLLQPADEAPGPAEGAARALRRWALAGCNRFVLYSERERETCARTFGVPLERCAFVPFHTRRTPAEAPVPGRGPLLAAGRSLRDYGTLARALRRTRVEVDVVAPAAERARFVGVPGARFLGELQDQAYRDRLADSAGVVIPVVETARSAGQAVLLEAMGLGKPAVVADVPGMRDYFVPEETALTYAPGDDAELARQLERLAGDPALRRRLGQAALQRARERYTPEQHARAVLALARECVRGAA